VGRGAKFQTEYSSSTCPNRSSSRTAKKLKTFPRRFTRKRLSNRVELHTVGGVASRNLRQPRVATTHPQRVGGAKNTSRCISPPVEQAVRRAWPAIFQGQQDRHARFCCASANSRPRTTPVSENIKRIIGHINAHPKCSRRQLMEASRHRPNRRIIEIKPGSNPAHDREPGTPEQTTIIRFAWLAASRSRHWGKNYFFSF